MDKQPKVKYLILGSASRELLAQSSESLAGRISYVEMGGFSLEILPEEAAQNLWIRGGFPRSFLATSTPASFQWVLYPGHDHYYPLDQRASVVSIKLS